LPNGGGTVSFKYDIFGRRVQKTTPGGTTDYLYDGADAVEELDGVGTVVARYSQGLNIDEPFGMQRSGLTSFFNGDGLGSVTSLTNATGSLAQTYTFDSFGKQTASDGLLTNPFRFTGRDFDSETALLYLRARYLDSANGRFLREDPVYIWSRIPSELNAYTYARNRPISLVDPLGQETGATMVQLWGTPPKVNPTGSLNLYGHWCGPGGWGTVVDELDGFCNEHDNCYKVAGVSWENNVGKPLSPSQTCALKQCDAALCGHLFAYRPTTRYQRILVPAMEVFFECIPGYGKHEFIKQIFSSF